ncbi:thioredoxin domain-containing protein 17-like [Elysia marginata]|uniref:Thioredoxin domain-containing protein 17 n=1 Tax=Elysia marginata TaxID=1093978 RepID=A0AAV4G5S7_9GAST|nr:thioredoxin domain-containing protein 17-like [Elysia marginata]
MVKKIEVEGYNALIECLKENNTGTVFVHFSGSLDENGVNWCPDCVKADPVIARNVDKAPEDSIFIHCHVGPKAYWKDQNNDFRQDPKFYLRCVPTLLRIGSPQRLQEDQCCSDDLVQMMLEETEENVTPRY